MIQHLNPSHFYVNNAQQLCNKIQGNSFVMFTSPTCVYCTNLYPSFTRLSDSLRGCVFAVMDVEKDRRKMLAIASKSQTPIEYVPYVVLYANGVPIKEYIPLENNPDQNFALMRSFLINETTKRSDQQQKRTYTNYNKQQEHGGGETSSKEDARYVNIPPYSIGIPGNRARGRTGVCHMKYNAAYIKV